MRRQGAELDDWRLIPAQLASLTVSLMKVNMDLWGKVSAPSRDAAPRARGAGAAGQLPLSRMRRDEMLQELQQRVGEAPPLLASAAELRAMLKQVRGQQGSSRGGGGDSGGGSSSAESGL